MSRESIAQEVIAERLYQEQRFGNDADDTLNTPNDFVSFISYHSTRWFGGGFAPYSAETTAAFRKQMIKVAALAFAAVESLDRQTEEHGSPFYQKA
jgi:hypothetical protein